MNIDEIKQMWSIDCEIDETQLTRESLKSPHLHSKYLDILINSKMKVVAYRHDLSRKSLLKIRYWRGELTKDELLENNLPQYLYSNPVPREKT